MIFRKPQPVDSSLHHIHACINSNPALKLSIFEVSNDGNVLVVFCNEESMMGLVKHYLSDHWFGEIEVYCPSSLLTGFNEINKLQDKPYKNMDKSLRYLN